MTRNKPISFTRFQIRVSANSLIKCGYCSTIDANAIFPNQRKAEPQKCFISASAGCVWIVPLYGHNGGARIAPNDWRKLVNEAPIVSCDLSPVTLTEEMRKDAREQASSWADAGERQLKEAHADYRPELNPVITGASGTVKQGRRPMYQPRATEAR